VPRYRPAPGKADEEKVLSRATCTCSE
jgi:hypothetical protein